MDVKCFKYMMGGTVLKFHSYTSNIICACKPLVCVLDSHDYISYSLNKSNSYNNYVYYQLINFSW